MFFFEHLMEWLMDPDDLEFVPTSPSPTHALEEPHPRSVTIGLSELCESILHVQCSILPVPLVLMLPS